MPTKTSTIRFRDLGVSAVLVRESDGVQRAEYISSFTGMEHGTAVKARWNNFVTARNRFDDEKTFAVLKHFNTTDQAFAAARRWVVATSIGA